MHLTMYTDYALRTLIYLATHPEGGTVGEIAEAYGISRNHLVKVAHNLGKSGYILTVKGRSGGLTLARPAAKIRVGDIVRDMEPNMDLVECFGGSSKCPISPVCRLRSALGKANKAFMDALDEYTLAAVASNRSDLAALLKNDSRRS